jgi:hypothetical protein
VGLRVVKGTREKGAFGIKYKGGEMLLNLFVKKERKRGGGEGRKRERKRRKCAREKVRDLLCLREETKRESVNIRVVRVERNERERERERERNKDRTKESEKERAGSDKIYIIQTLRHEGY